MFQVSNKNGILDMSFTPQDFLPMHLAGLRSNPTDRHHSVSDFSCMRIIARTARKLRMWKTPATAVVAAPNSFILRIWGKPLSATNHNGSTMSQEGTCFFYNKCRVPPYFSAHLLERSSSSSHWEPQPNQLSLAQMYLYFQSATECVLFQQILKGVPFFYPGD